MREEVALRQILLITDGCSNVGVDPIHVALLASEQRVAVSVIGILDDGILGDRGKQEVISIAAAGKGMYRLTKSADLANSVQVMTRQTMHSTLQGAVLSEWGMDSSVSLEALPPELRPQLAREVEYASECAALEICLVLDMSGSMNPKRGAVREAVRDLISSLSLRTGQYRLDVVVFPDEKTGSARHISVPEQRLADTVGRIKAQGNTPTGPALALALQIFIANKTKNSIECDPTDSSVNGHFGGMGFYVG